MEDKQAEYDASFEEEKRRYEADRWNYWGNPNSPWAREEARRQRRERRRSGGRRADFSGRAHSEARAVEPEDESFEDVDGPADEVEALRARLVAAMRRQPGDVRFLMRSAQDLWRMEAAAHRLSPDKQHELGRSMLGVLNSLNDPRILPPED